MKVWQQFISKGVETPHIRAVPIKGKQSLIRDANELLPVLIYGFNMGF